MRYVRFWRGSSNDFERITYKQEDTMYFVIQPDTNSFIIYLGDNELLSGDDLNSSSIDALEDVIISKNLHDRQVLMYDALQECWVNASLDKAAGAYVGPTADFQGLPGMLPGAPAGSENLFFRSDGKWVEQHIEKINNLEGLEHYELIGNIIAQWPEVNKNDLIIIEDILSNGLKNDIAYWYDGKEWLSVTHSSIPFDYAENDPQAPSYILNRPFYDNSTMEPLEVTFDGDLTGKPVVGFVVPLVKLSDAVPTLDEIRAGEITIHISDNGQIREENVPVSELDLVDGSSEGVPAYLALWDNTIIGVLAYEDFVVEGVAVTKGIYGICFIEGSNTAYVSRLYIPSVTYEDIKKLDNKFIDAEWTAYVQPAEKTIFEEQEVTEFQTYTLNSPFPAYPITANVTCNGENYSCSVSSISGGFFFGNLSIIGDNPDTGEPFLCACAENEITFIFAIGVSATISVSIVYEDFAKIPDKFLPEGQVTVDWVSESLWEFNQKLLQPWLSGATVIVTGVPDIGEMRLLYLDTRDSLGDLWSAVFVTNGGSLYLTSNIIYGDGNLNGIVKLVSFGYDTLNYQFPVDTDGQVLVGQNNGFSPVELNGTLTEGSTLPAQEGAVYTAIQEIKNLITPLNEALEAALEGGN